MRSIYTVADLKQTLSKYPEDTFIYFAPISDDDSEHGCSVIWGIDESYFDPELGEESFLLFQTHNIYDDDINSLIEEFLG